MTERLVGHGLIEAGLPPIIPPAPVPPEALTAAEHIRAHRNADPFSAIGRTRHNLGVVALAAGTSLAAGYTMFVDGTLALTDIPSGVVYGAAGNLLIGSGAYAAGRLLESRKVRRAAAQQAKVREGIGQPVDIFRGMAGDKKAKVLRWYGYDAAFTESADPSEPTAGHGPSVQTAVLSGLTSVVELAGKAKLTHIAMSARVLRLVPKADVDTFGRVCNGSIANKRIAATDLVADDEVLVCRVDGAETLLRKLQEQAGSDALERVADLLRQVRPAHPFLTHAFPLLSKNFSDKYARNEAERILRDAVERSFAVGTTTGQRITDGGHVVGYNRVPIMRHLNGRHVQESGTFSLANGHQETRFIDSPSLLQMTGFETVAALLDDTAKRRLILNPTVVQERAEIAAYLLLYGATARGGSPKDAIAKPTESTFLERVIEEPPRSILGYLRSTGRHAGDEPTIEYHKHGVPRLRRALGTLALFASVVAAGGAAGYGAHTALEDNFKTIMHNYAVSHGDKDGQLAGDQYDAFFRYLGGAPGFRASADHAFEGAQGFDTTIVDGMAALFPPGLGAKLAPYAGRDWLYQKESALRSYNNAYSDGANSSTVGDVYTNPNGVAWQLTPSPGVSTEGYWVQSVQEYVNTDSSMNGSSQVWTPPYSNFGVDFLGADPNGPNVDEGRFLDLQNPHDLPPHGSYIRVDGRKVMDDLSTSLIVLEDDKHITSTYSGYALPVLNGDRIVAATAKMYSIVNNQYFGDVKFKVAQLANGTAYLVIDPTMFQYVTPGNYMDISYWITQDKLASRVHATAPLTMNGHGNVSVPFTQGYSAEDALRVWRQLSGNPHAAALPSVEEAAAFINAHKKYSFTPYADNHVPLTLDKPVNQSTGLSTIGVTAASMTSDNCNLTVLLDVLTSQAKTASGGFADSTVGYHNNGDNELLTGDAHAWLTTNTGAVVDGTPGGADASSGGGTESFDPNANPADELIADIELVLKGLLAAGGLAGTAYAAKRFGPTIVAEVSDRTAESAAARILPDPEEDAEPAQTRRLHRAASILQWMLYRPKPISVLDEAELPTHFGAAEQQNLVDRYHGILPIGRRQVRHLIEKFERNGALRLSPATRRQVLSFARNHKRAQSVLKALYATAHGVTDGDDEGL